MVQLGARLFASAERWVRRALVAAKHEQLSGIVFWAALIGVCGAFTGVAFRASVRLVQRLLTGSSAGLVETAELLPWWARIAVPNVGGVLAGLLLWAAQRVPRQTRRVDYMEAVAVGNGQLSSRAALLQAASSFFSIGSGASIGREGPLVQMAATVASKIGQWTQAPVPRLRLLVACGAAAGVAAAYNAPIAGALFVAEVVLGSIAMESFGPLIVSSVVSDATTRHFLGYGPGPAQLIPGMSPWSVNWTDYSGTAHTTPLDINCHCFDPTKTQVLNPNAFTNVPNGVFAANQASIRSFRGPRIPSENANFSRNFRIKERYTFQIRAEFTNIFNRMVWPTPLFGATAINVGSFATAPTLYTSGPNKGLYSGGFGTIVPETTASGQRSGTLVARFSF